MQVNILLNKDIVNVNTFEYNIWNVINTISVRIR